MKNLNTKTSHFLIKTLLAGTMAFGLGISVVAAADYGDNSIYLDQSGTGGTITINQAGDNNSIGAASAILVYGDVVASSDDETLTIDQSGSGNSLNFDIALADGTTTDITQYGTYNAIVLTLGSGYVVSDSSLTLDVSGTLNTVEIIQGKYAIATDSIQDITVAGTSNTYTSNLDAIGVTNTINMSGTSNTITMDQTSANATLDITQSGTGQTLIINQCSTFTSGAC